MIGVSVIDQTGLIIFWLIFMRWLAILIHLPIFDDISVPAMVKILTALIISYAFYPALSGEVMKDVAYVGVENFWALSVFYGVVGLAIGYVVKSILAIFTAAGTIITQQIGFDAVRYFDTQASQEVGPIEKLVGWTILVMVITSGALIPMFKGIYGSFFSIHFYDLGNLANVTAFFISFFKSIFLSALMLASPIIFTNLLITSVLGIIARTVPQMNIIMVSFVVNIGLGLIVFFASSNEFFQVAFRIYTKKLGEWFQFVT